MILLARDIAKKIEADPEQSPVYAEDLAYKEKNAAVASVEILPNERYLGKTVKNFAGSLPAFLTAFTSRKKLTEEEIAAIVRIIEGNRG